jgi:hypothetical protein
MGVGAVSKRRRNLTINIRVTEEEIAAAKDFGNGNASHGYRMALRIATGRKSKPIPLSTLLRAAAEMAAELEESPKRGAPRNQHE